MAKVIPTTLPLVDRLGIAANAPVRASDYKDVIETQHFVYAQSGAHFSAFAGFIQYADNVNWVPLATFVPLRATRKWDEGTDPVYRWLIEAYGFSFQLRVRLWWDEANFQEEILNNAGTGYASTPITVSEAGVVDYMVTVEGRGISPTLTGSNSLVTLRPAALDPFGNW